MGKGRKHHLISKNLFYLEQQIQDLKQKHATQFATAQSESDVYATFDVAEYICDVNKLAELNKEMPDFVKIKEMDCPLKDLKGEGEIVLRDMVLNIRGPQEDEIFALDTFLMKNVRRGNTIIEIVEKQMIVDSQ